MVIGWPLLAALGLHRPPQLVNCSVPMFWDTEDQKYCKFVYKVPWPLSLDIVLFLSVICFHKRLNVGWVADGQHKRTAGELFLRLPLLYDLVSTECQVSDAASSWSEIQGRLVAAATRCCDIFGLFESRTLGFAIVLEDLLNVVNG